MSYNPAYAYAPAQPVAIAAPYQGPHYSMQQQQQQPVQYAPSPPIRAQQQAAYLPSQPQHFHNSAIRPPTFQPVQAAPVGLAPTVTKPYTQCIAASACACARCGAVYPLPAGASSWRCKQCNAMNGGGNLGCAIL